MKAIFIFIAVINLTMPCVAQEIQEEVPKPVEVKVSGFILNNLFFDNRKNVDALDGMVLLFPLPEVKDNVGNDLNKVPNITLLSFASRMKFSISGPDAFRAKTSGFIEFDFTGRSNTASLRFRQAWTRFSWEKTEILVGRAWHPLASTDVVPSVMALSIGAPFQPFNRSDQITLTRKAGNLSYIISALYQNDYSNNGPAGKSYSPQNNALIPNLHAQLRYQNENVILGAGIDYKKLKPRTFVTSPSNGSEKTETNAHVDCAALLVYGQYKSGRFSISGKTIWSSNTSESLMTGAFATVSRDSLTGHEEYTPFRHFFAWGNISYGGRIKGSLFAGYLKNLGTSRNFLPHSTGSPSVYGLGESIGQMVRITPTVSYTSGKTILAFEMEHNIAQYGAIDNNDKGKIINTKNVTGTRLQATLLYNF